MASAASRARQHYTYDAAESCRRASPEGRRWLGSRERQSPEIPAAQRARERRLDRSPGPTRVGRRAAGFAASLPPALSLEFGVRLVSASLTAPVARAAQPAEDARPLAARV